MGNALRQSLLVLRERLSPRRLARQPEPAVMDEAESVQAFHQAGELGGHFFVGYHRNARAVSQLLPANGTLVDLGCGSAQFLAYLARCRPDARLIGIDLSSRMLELGRRTLDAAGLSERVRLIEGDMCDFERHAGPALDVVCANQALHHLPSLPDLHRFCGALAAARARTGCGFWIFDLARLRHPASPDALLSLSPPMPRAFANDWLHSMRAAYSLAEMESALAASGIRGASHLGFGLWREGQAHWAPPVREAPAGAWREPELEPALRQRLARPARFVRGLPGRNEA